MFGLLGMLYIERESGCCLRVAWTMFTRKMLTDELLMQPIAESEDEDAPRPPLPSQSPLPDRIGFIGAGQVTGNMMLNIQSRKSTHTLATHTQE